MQIKIKKLKDNAKLPTYAHAGDVGMDLFSTEKIKIKKGEQVIIWHGFALEFPQGYGAFVFDKSSTAKNGLKTLGGVFDAGYRGEYNTQIINLSKKTYTIETGDKVAQLIILPVKIPKLKIVKNLSKTSRGDGRFGSTGRQ